MSDGEVEGRLDGSTVIRRADVLWRIAPGFLAVSTVDGEALTAGGPAAEIWQLLAQPTTVDELCTQLAARHAIEAAQVRADVTPFLTELIEADYVCIDHVESPGGRNG